jgi:hypothetical protein
MCVDHKKVRYTSGNSPSLYEIKLHGRSDGDDMILELESQLDKDESRLDQVDDPYPD